MDWMQPESFPWRSLGTLLVDDGLLTDVQLDLALAEQRRSGRLLGQILVDFGYVTGLALARILAEQHGVQLQTESLGQQDNPPVAGTSAPATSWVPLGKLLVRKGFVKGHQLEEALAEQSKHPSSRLGEILVARGYLSGAGLARALAEQHGVDLGQEPGLDDVETTLKPAVEGEPMYLVCKVSPMQGYQKLSVLYQNPNFLEATDFAFEYVDEHEPDALEIQLSNGDERETVWTYSAARAAAMAADRKDLVETFGFDPTRWGKDRY
jgi:hypothetical protein